MNQRYISVPSRHLYKSCSSLSSCHSTTAKKQIPVSTISQLPICRDSLLKLPIASFVMEWSTKMTQRPVFLRFSQWKSHQCSLPSRVSLHGSRGCYCKWSCAAEKLCELGRLTDFSRIYPHPILLWYRLIKKIKKNTFAICSTCFVDWFVADLIAGWLACLLAWLFDWLIAWLLGWLIDGWLAGWPAGTAVSCLDFSR